MAPKTKDPLIDCAWTMALHIDSPAPLDGDAMALAKRREMSANYGELEAINTERQDATP